MIKILQFINNPVQYIKFSKRFFSFYIKGKRLKFADQVLRDTLLSKRTEVEKVCSGVEKCYEYMLKNDISIFNNEFEEKYIADSIQVVVNDDCTKYVEEKYGKVYYPPIYDELKIKEIHNSINIEQDISSPHRYLDEGENLNDYIFFDCGTAEGSMPLSIVNDVKQLYLFEADEKWIHELKRTFACFEDKVTINKKFVSDTNSESAISLCDYILELERKGRIDLINDKIFIKMDIEGYEKRVFENILPIIKKARHVKMAVCLYHNQEDENAIINLIPNSCNYRIRDGWMLFRYDPNLAFPYFRHGIVRIEKDEL